ncbi:SH3 domain-containing protein [Rhizobium sp. XQZ8]|nr:SH3 domain-containing protein [Rhizobium populisoli]
MKKFLMSVAALAALFVAPSIANAAVSGFSTANVNMRSGPSTGYPAVTVIPEGTSVTIFGCMSSVNWCDVQFFGGRGWVSGSYVQAAYQSRRVYVEPDYYPRLGIPTVTFDVDNYWGRYYSGRDFYRERDRWRRYDWRSERPLPPPPRWDRDRDPPRWDRDDRRPPPPPRWDRDQPRFDRDRDQPRWDRDRDRDRDQPRFDRDRNPPRFDRDRDQPRFDRDRNDDRRPPRIDRDPPRFDRDRDRDNRPPRVDRPRDNDRPPIPRGDNGRNSIGDANRSGGNIRPHDNTTRGQGQNCSNTPMGCKD